MPIQSILEILDRSYLRELSTSFVNLDIEITVKNRLFYKKAARKCLKIV